MEELEEAVEEFVADYRRGVVNAVSGFLDEWIDYGPERTRIEKKLLPVIEDSSSKIGRILKRVPVTDDED